MDIGIQIALLHRGIYAPDAGKNHHAPYHFPGIPHKYLQQKPLSGRQLQFAFWPAQNPQGIVIGNIAKLQEAVILIFLAAPAKGADACQQFFKCKRLYNIVAFMRERKIITENGFVM